MTNPINKGKQDPNHRHRHSSGYIQLYRPYHPYCDNHGYVMEHRLVLEEKLGFHIDSRKYHVHHIDGVKDNNKLENLQLVTPEEHHRIENGWKQIDGVWFKPCYVCKEMLPNTPDNFYFRKSGTKRSIASCKPCTKKISIEARENRIRIPFTCEFCKKEVFKNHYGKQRFCSIKCSHLGYSTGQVKRTKKE